MRITKETDKLYRLTRFGIINCFLVVEDDGGTLIDTGVAGSASAILDAARRVELPIRRILLTHAHVDHVGSLDALRAAASGVRVFIGAREAPLLAGEFSGYGSDPKKKPYLFKQTRVRPDGVLVDGQMIGSLRTIDTPGHTLGHVAYFDARDGSLIAGDAFTTQLGVVVAGVFKFYFPMAAWFAWNLAAGAESARKMCALRPKRLASGHGATIENPIRAMEQATDLALQQARKSKT